MRRTPDATDDRAEPSLATSPVHGRTLERGRERAVTRLTGPVGFLTVTATGAVLDVAVRPSLPGLIVMLAGALGLAVVLIRSEGDPGRTERSRRVGIAAKHDPDREYFDALRDVPTTETTANPHAARPRVEERESRGAYRTGSGSQPRADQR